MTAPLQLFNTRNARFVDADGKLTREAISMFETLFNRVGGAVAPSNTDLAQSDDDDSGLEEFKAENSKTVDGLAMAPVVNFREYEDPMHPVRQEHSEVQQLQSEVSELRSLVTELVKELHGLQQGTNL